MTTYGDQSIGGPMMTEVDKQKLQNLIYLDVRTAFSKLGYHVSYDHKLRETWVPKDSPSFDDLNDALHLLAQAVERAALLGEVEPCCELENVLGVCSC